MNKRIRELAEQAGFYYTDKTGFITPAGCDPAKFAFLLMREIATVQIIYQASMDLENKKMDDPAKELNYAVIEHFGVGK
jgi:hypothetical protein